jgi:hypothetical protein
MVQLAPVSSTQLLFTLSFPSEKADFEIHHPVIEAPINKLPKNNNVSIIIASMLKTKLISDEGKVSIAA